MPDETVQSGALARDPLGATLEPEGTDALVAGDPGNPCRGAGESTVVCNFSAAAGDS